MMEFDLICVSCKNYDVEKQTCLAFPKQIPDEIWIGLDNHETPLPNQENNIVFEPID